jgi:AcrR family transcriptional regulator
MTTPPTKSEANRSIGKHQLDEQRASILDAAETLFLQNGLSNTSMIEIASQAGISKVTLYRYFANRDVIALEIQKRMLNKVSETIDSDQPLHSREALKKQVVSMIRNFELLQDAYRYIGMFDKIYLDNAPDVALTKWTKEQLSLSTWKKDPADKNTLDRQAKNEFSVVMNTVIWFLEKLALRGELTWSDREIPLEQHLKIFEKLILSYFDQVADSETHEEQITAS